MFGSVARGEDQPDSDIDLIVTFERPVGLLRLIRLERELAEVTGRRVDLFTEAALHPRIRERVLAEQWVIFDDAP